MTPAVSRVRKAQGERLTRLRTLLGLTQTDAYGRAGISRHAWSRMEKGDANIDAVALARFCASFPLPGEYVLTGGLDGLPDHIKRAVIEDELRARLAVGSGNEELSATSPERTPKLGGRARSARAGTQADQPQRAKVKTR